MLSLPTEAMRLMKGCSAAVALSPDFGISVCGSKLPAAPFATPDQPLANQQVIFPSRLAGRRWLLVARYGVHRREFKP
jgi:hypothetical protein